MSALTGLGLANAAMGVRGGSRTDRIAAYVRMGGDDA